MKGRIHTYRWLMLAFFWIAGIVHTAAQEIKFIGSVSKSKVSIGEVFQLSYTVNVSAQRFDGPDLSEFVNYGGPNQSSSVQIVNGQMTQSFTFFYRLAARKEGKFTIAPATVTVANGKIKSNTIDIEVVAASAQTNPGQQQSGGQTAPQRQQQPASGVSDDKLFIKASVSKSEVYQNEQIVVTYKLYSKFGSINISDFKFPSFNGFYSYEIESSKNTTLQQEVYNGEMFYAAELKQTILLPQRSGMLDIPALEAEFIVRERTAPQSIFEQFFGGGYRDVNFKTKSRPLKIKVNPFPNQGKPANFSGANGDFTIKAEMDKASLKTNDAVNLKVTINGKGSIKLIDKINIDFPVEWEVYDPQITDKVNINASGISGSRTFEYLIIPKAGGKYNLGPIVFDYFDPIKRSYVSTQTDVITIDVERGKDDPVYSSGRQGSKSEVKILGTDIRFISSKPGRLMLRQSGSFFGSRLFYILAIIPPILILLMFAFKRYKDKENADVSGMKIRKAGSLAQARLKHASQAMKVADKEQFFQETSKALFGFISDKFLIPPGDLSRDNIQQKLLEKGIQPETITNVIKVLDQCELARFAPSQALEMQTVYEQSLKLIQTLNQSVKK